MSNNKKESRFGPPQAVAVTLATTLAVCAGNWVIKNVGSNHNQNKIANSTLYDNSHDINENTYCYSKEDFTRLLSQATGANNIEVEDASSYKVVTQTNNINGTIYYYYFVDDNVVFKEAYANTGNIGVCDYEEIYDDWANEITVSTGEDGARVTKKIITSRNAMFDALEESDEFVDAFAGDEKYWDAVAAYPLDDGTYCFYGTTRLGKDGNPTTTYNEYSMEWQGDKNVLFTQILNGKGEVIYQDVGPNVEDQKVLAYK